MDFTSFCKELEQDIQNAYESAPTIEEAERLAAKFLGAQLTVGAELSKADLDARMRKAGAKAVGAAVYMDAATKDAKKPSDVMLAAVVDMNELVMTERKALDEAEVKRDALENTLRVAREAHIYFRGLAKGRFE
jgi:hypothetical protein